MNSVIKKFIDADDVTSFSTNINESDFTKITVNQTNNINGSEITNPNLIQYAIINDKPLCLSFILQSSPDFRGMMAIKKPNFYITEHQYNFLHLAIIKQSYKSIGVILECVHSHPEMINEMSTEGYTPLHLAVSYDMHTIVLKLLQYGANPLIRDKEGFTPLHTAILKSRRSTDIICKYLQLNYPRAFFHLIHRPVGALNDLLDFALTSKIQDNVRTLQHFDQMLTGTPAQDEPEPGILEFKSNYAQKEAENGEEANGAQNISNASYSMTCSATSCIHYKRLMRCHICGKMFCPLHIGEHAHQRLVFFG